MVSVGPSPGFSSRGGQKTEGGPHFLNTVLDVCSNRWAKREMGGTDFNGGRAPLPPRWRRSWIDTPTLDQNTIYSINNQSLTLSSNELKNFPPQCRT